MEASPVFPSKEAKLLSEAISALLLEHLSEVSPIEVTAVLAQFTGLASAHAIDDGHHPLSVRQCVDLNIQTVLDKFLAALKADLEGTV